MFLAVCFIMVLVHVCLRSTDCKCDTQYEDSAATTASNGLQSPPVPLQPAFNPQFEQTAYPQSTAPLQVQLPPPGMAPSMELLVGEPPPPYPGM